MPLLQLPEALVQISAKKKYCFPVSPDVPPFTKLAVLNPVAVSVKSRLAVTELLAPVKSNPYCCDPCHRN